MMVCRSFVLVSLVAAAPQNPSSPPQTQAQQRPVFRGGTHFVRVDAYPTTKDGKIVEGLTADDFTSSRFVRLRRYRVYMDDYGHGWHEHRHLHSDRKL